MVANISHELRTPIANIRLIIDSLFMDTAKPGRKNSIRSLHAIGRETDALQWMSEELLDLSMIESGQALMKMVDVPTSDVVAGAVERMADFCEDRDVRIVQKVPRNLYVLCDQGKLVRVLVNLLHNALKWSPRGEKIRVVVTREGDEILFGVIDRGEGVPKEFTGRIFERMRSEREKIARRLRAEGEEEARSRRAAADREVEIIIAAADRDSSRLRGEGEAEAISILADALNQDPDFYSFRRSLDAYRQFLSTQSTMVLTSDSDLFEFLQSAGGNGSADSR